MKKSIFRKILGFLTVFAILLSLFAFSGCSATEYQVFYLGNGNTSGSENVPTDNIDYYYGSTATVKPQGSMVFPDHYFIVWNTAADGSGTDYEDGDAILMTQNITLYAQWTDAVTANIMGKTIKDAELNGSTYNAANSIYITEDYSYGMEAWLYVDTEAHSTLKISEFASNSGRSRCHNNIKERQQRYRV